MSFDTARPTRLSQLVSATALAIAALTASCSAEPRVVEGASREESQAIRNGTPADPTNYGYVMFADTGLQSACAGILVAPKLMTAPRHCVLTWSGLSTTCAFQDSAQPPPSFGQPLDADLEVFHFRDHTLGDEPDALVTKYYSTTSADPCVDDLALLVLDHELDFDPAPLVLEGAPDDGAELVSIGLGTVDQTNTTTHVPLEATVSLLAVGPSVYTLSPYPSIVVKDGIALVDAGACNAQDLGGPLVADTGGVVGFPTWVGNVDPSKLKTIDFNKPFTWCSEGGIAGSLVLSHYADQLESWFRDAGYTPRLVGRPPPSKLGGPCSDELDCHTRLCVNDGSASICSTSCQSAECPEGYACYDATGGQKVCMPKVSTANQVGSGCATGGTTPSKTSSMLVILFGTLLALRRRRRRFAPRSTRLGKP